MVEGETSLCVSRSLSAGSLSGCQLLQYMNMTFYQTYIVQYITATGLPFISS